VRQIVINSTAEETRVALLDGPSLLELFIERTRSRGVAGNIYKGRVTRVMPGLQAAFVEIGLEKGAFLHASGHQAEIIGAVEAAEGDGSADIQPARRAPIEESLQRGHQVVVQVTKEPMHGKGARVTEQIALPGRHLVYLPQAKGIGVSRRIESSEERERLRELVRSVLPETGGVIVRTSAEGLGKRELAGDVRFLTRLWDRIAARIGAAAAPSLLHHGMDLILRVARDLFSGDVHQVIVDSAREHHRIVSFLESTMPKLAPRVSLYDDAEPIFERFQLEQQIRRALERVVRLKTGGYIAIDQTEALTAIDVNSGRYAGGKNPDETALDTNLEAVKVIVDQLRLRNLGGLIVIDFIDMSRAASRRKVFEALSVALKKDKARTNVLSVSPLGLVEMTRRRTRESLLEVLCSSCPQCGGSGRVQAPATVAHAILRRLKHEAKAQPGVARFTVTARPEVVKVLADDEQQALKQIERDSGKRIVVTAADLPAGAPFEVLGHV
jgi:ribonuclease G